MIDKSRPLIILNIMLILSLALTGCGKGVLDVQIVPQGEATVSVQQSLSNDALAQIQPIALSFLVGGSADRRPFLQYQTTPCSNQPGSDQPPCSPGESEGQPLQVFPLGADQTVYLRLEDISQTLDFQVKDLYAIYRFPQDQTGLPPEQRGEYGLLFDRENSGQPEPVLAVIANSRLVRLEFYPGLKVEIVLNRVPVAQVILPPQQAQAWSEGMQKMQLQSRIEISPDRRWTAQTTIALPAQKGQNYYRRLIVFSQDGSQSYTLVDEWLPYDSIYSMPQPLAWFGMSSTELPVLYWTDIPVVEGCGVLYNGTDLHRLELESGISQALLGEVGTWLAVSPDQSRAAAVGTAGLGIYDLSSGQGHFTALTDGQAGQVVWSPDGREVALTIIHDPCGARESITHTILRIDADTLEIKTRLAHDPRQLVTQRWSQLGFIELTGKESTLWLMDPQTGEVWDESVGRNVATASAPVQLHFFANLYEQDIAALRKLSDQFAAENPGIQVIFSNPWEMQQTFDPSSDDGTIASLNKVDCFADWAMPSDYAHRSDLLLSLNPLLASAGSELRDGFWPEQLAGFRLDGKLYGLPLFERPAMIHYNADLLVKKGLAAPAPDWKYEDFVTLLRSVSAGQSGDKMYGFLAFEDSSVGQFVEGLFASVFDTSTNPPTDRFVSTEMAAGLERLAQLRQSGALVFLPGTLYAGKDYYDAADAWLAGQLAFWQSPFGELSPVPAVEKLPGFQIGVAPLPGADELFQFGYSVPENFYIVRNSPNSNACWTWYRYVTSHPEATSSVPARRSMLENAAWRARVGEANAVALRTALERIYTRPMRRFQLDIEDPLETWLFRAIFDYLKGVDAQTVMTIAQAKADIYTACISPQASLEGTALSDAIIACSRQADPGQ